MSSTIKSNGQNVLRSEDEMLFSSNLKAFTLNELKIATQNFRPEGLSEGGGFDCVYKGWIDEQTLSPNNAGSGIVVGVDKLNTEDFRGQKEWLKILNYLCHVHHSNVVKLIGYCLDGERVFLVHEFMSKGSLENHLFRRGPQPLSWATRVKVAVGISRGLSFLHDAESQIIYRDLKPSNILLDDEFNAKLSDFSLAKFGPKEDETHLSTEVVGTYGYAAPEYVATGHLSAKSDVYSYGVVLLELLTGRRTVDRSRVAAEQSLVDWAKPYLRHKRSLFRIMDAKLEGQYPKKAALAVAAVALQCLSPEPRLRPTMSEVLLELEKLQNLESSPQNSSAPHKDVSSPSNCHPILSCLFAKR